MVIITKKVKCNGRKFQGYKYHVNVTDGNVILYFHSDGGDKLHIEDLHRVETRNRDYSFDTNIGLQALPLCGDGKNDDMEERTEIKWLVYYTQFVPIIFVGEDCEHTYIF